MQRTFLAIAFACASGSIAQAQSFGDWGSGTTGGGALLFAATVNDSGNVLGQYCSPSTDTCVWLLGMNTSCTSGNKYPVLANSDAGSQQLEVYCDGQLENGLYRYAFGNFDAVDAIVREGSRVGFAVPLQSDQFRVLRFSLIGATKTIAAMQAAAEARTKPTKRGTRDQMM